MSLRSRLLILHAFALAPGVRAQFPGRIESLRPPDGWPAETVEIYQPIVMDSTLLFPAPWLVWQCTCERKDEYAFYSEVDFRVVRKCWGRKEVFDRVEVAGVYAFVQCGLGRLHATLEETGDGFLYTEVIADSLDNATPTRTVQLAWDTDHVVRTDTSTMFQWNSDALITRLTRYVELKRADRPQPIRKR